MKKYQGSIRKELLRNILLIVFIATIIGYGIFLKMYMDNEQKKDIALAHTISQIIGQDVAKIVYTNDITVASDVTTQLHSFQTLAQLILYKKDKEILFQYTQDNTTHATTEKCTQRQFKHTIIKDKHLIFCTKIFYKGIFLADAQFVFKIESFEDIFLDSLPFLLFLLLTMLFVAYFLSLYQANKFTAPIITLVKFLENIQNEKFLRRRLKIEHTNEFGMLYDEINTMLTRLEESYDELTIAAVAFETPTAMLISDKEKKILRVNSAFKKMTGFREQELIGTTPSFINSQDKEVQIQTKDNRSFEASLTIQTVTKDNTVQYYVISLIDISKQKAMEKELEQLVHYDPLTGLMNRSLLKERLNILLSNNTKSYGFLCFDIENFRLINEGYNFDFGNKLLQKIATRLEEEYTQTTECIAKIGIDEFLLCFAYDATANIVAEMEFEAQKITQLLSEPFLIDGNYITISIHIGITTANAYTQKDAQEIIKEAIGAVNIAKESDIRVAFYNRTYQKSSLEHIDMYSQLTTAIHKEQFKLFYQLQNNAKQEVIGAEALIRWIQPDGTVIPPYKFIPLLEKSGLILQLSNWIVESACKQLAQWQQNEETKHLTISINACAKEFNSKMFLTNIQKNLQKYNIPKGLLKVELLESMLADNIELILEKMNALKAIGVNIALDDFGTGYSSLSYLKKLPIDQIKIDQTFVKNITTSKKDQAIVKSIVLLKDAFGIRVIAEGVETQEDAAMLQKLGCTLYQGYYFAKPKPIEEITLKRGGVIL